jgi:hypothetical protein
MPRDLHLAALLDFRPAQGVIRLHEQRVVLLSAAAMGLMRRELIDTFGPETARRILLRFGFADGYHDAVNLRARSHWTRPIDGLRAGATLHTLEGIVRADVRGIDYDEATGRFEEEVWWHDSYEAEQHVLHYGTGADPVCWSLAGYSSGFASACLGREIYFKEAACAGAGAGHCMAIGHDAESWGDEAEAIRADFQAARVGPEVERLGAAVSRRIRALDQRERRLEQREQELNVWRERIRAHAAAKRFVAGAIAPRSPRPCLSPSSSDTCGAPSPAPCATRPGCSKWPATARSFSTRSAMWRRRSRRSCCARCRSGRSVAWAPSGTSACRRG